MRYPYFGRTKKKNKYNAKKVEFDGLTFDSQKEVLRYKELCSLCSEGIISNLQRQVKYILIPTQREPAQIGPRGGIKPGKLIENECSYLADFVYTVNETGETVVEDVKGYKKGEAYKVFTIKRKLMLFVYGIQVKEV